MKSLKCTVVAFEISIVLLLVRNVRGDTREWRNYDRRSYFDYGNVEDRSSIDRDNDTEARVPLTLNWRWLLKPQNKIKQTRQPSIDAINDENDRLPNDKFLFPNNDATPLAMNMRIGTAPICEGSTFCENVLEYPSDYVDTAVRNDPSLRNYENVDAVDNISFRIDTVSTESLCLSTQQIVYPKSAESMNKQWMYILNTANYTQGIYIETCTQEGKSCKLFGGFAAGYISSCEQKFTYRRLTAIAEDGSIIHDHFRFPASCCCHVRFVANSTRMRNDRSVESQSKRRRSVK